MTGENGYWQYRLGRRPLLRGMATASASLAATGLAGCRAERRPTDSSTEAREPKRGGTLVIRGSREIQGVQLDPHVSAPRTAQQFRLWAQGLLSYDLETYLPKPELAQKWEQPAPLDLIFTLHPGIRFHNKPPANGRLMTAHDVVWSLDRVRTPEPRFVNRSLFDSVEKIQAVDQATVKLTTKEPDASLLSNLSQDPVVVLAPEVVEQTQRFTTPADAVGSGAFIMTVLQENVSAEYVRNPDYWKPGLPYLDRVRTLNFANTETAWAAFLAGQLDIMIQVPGLEVKNYLARRGPDATPVWAADSGMTALFPNVLRKPMDDPRVTRALRLLINHEEFVTGWATREFGRGRNTFLFPPSMELWDLTHEEYYKHLYWKQPKDEAIRTALDLLRAAGFTRETPLKFELVIRNADYGLSGGELIHAQWRQLSQGVVQPELKPVDSPTQDRIRNSRDFSHAYLGMASGIIDPNIPLSQNYRSGSSRNYGGFSDPRADDLIDKQRRTFNTEERKAIIREIILHMMDRYGGELPAGHFVLNATKPEVRGFQPENANYMGKQYERVWLDT